MATVQLKQIRKSYGDHEIIRGIDLTLNDQELTVFVGPSGCGKSTLLRLIAGLEDIDSGDLLIDNTRVNDIAPAKRGLALVFQSYALYPHMNVAENMSFSLKLAGIPKPEREAKVLEAARILNLEQYLDRKPKDLSGGQRQRVAIGRAIVRNPKVFLFDEPLSNLDAALRVRMRLELTTLHRKLAATMIYVTHDQVEAMTMADRIVVLNAGRVEQVGTPMELYRTPRNLFVAGFIGSPKMNLLPAAILDDSTAHTIGIRPEHICLSNEGLPATVQLVEHLGSESYIHAQLATGEPITLRLNGETTLTPDQTIHLTFTPTHLHRFNTEGEALS